MEADIKATYPCSECPGGKLHQRQITYFTWLGDELITVPNFPAWVCDVCGRREYDPQAVARLNLFLNPNAGRPPAPLAGRRSKPVSKSTPPPLK